MIKYLTANWGVTAVIKLKWHRHFINIATNGWWGREMNGIFASCYIPSSDSLFLLLLFTFPLSLFPSFPLSRLHPSPSPFPRTRRLIAVSKCRLATNRLMNRLKLKSSRFLRLHFKTTRTPFRTRLLFQLFTAGTLGTSFHYNLLRRPNVNY